MAEPGGKTKRKKQGNNQDSVETTEIPSYGLEFFEYRRKLWLAGRPFPKPSSSSLPPTYTVPLEPPSPLLLPLPENAIRESPSVQRLEKILKHESAIGSKSTWNGGIADICKLMDEGSRLTRALPLNLVIKILRCKWVIDGTWTTDPITKRAAVAPDSPPRSTMSLTASRPKLPMIVNGLGQTQLSPPKAWKQVAVIGDGEDEVEALSDHHLESMGLSRAGSSRLPS